MKNAFKVLLAVLLVLIIPNLFIDKNLRLERSVEITSPINPVFMKFANVTEWQNWHPWFKQDSISTKLTQTVVYGSGANVEWNNEAFGRGKLILKTLDLNKSLDFELLCSDFLQVKVKGALTFKQVNRKTHVSLTIEQEYPFLLRILGLFAAKNFGKDLELGLQNLKKQVETSKEPFHILMYNKAAFSVYSKKEFCSTEEIGKTLENTYKDLQKVMEEDGIYIFGKPICIYHSYSDTTVVLEAALPVHQILTENSYTKTIAAATVLKATYVGSYEKTQATYDALDAFASRNGLSTSDTHYQIFITDPGSIQDPNKWVTEIYYTVTN